MLSTLLSIVFMFALASWMVGHVGIKLGPFGHALKTAGPLLLRALFVMFVQVPLIAARELGAWWGDRGRSTTCPACCRKIPGVATVTCSSCSYRSRRSIFSPCPCCGAALRHVRCPHCQFSVKRRALFTQPQPPRRYH